MTMPKAFIYGNSQHLWVMDDRVAVFSLPHAEIVFTHNHNLVALQVWGIRDGKAELLGGMSDAHRFFGE